MLRKKSAERKFEQFLPFCRLFFYLFCDLRWRLRLWRSIAGCFLVVSFHRHSYGQIYTNSDLKKKSGLEPHLTHAVGQLQWFDQQD